MRKKKLKELVVLSKISISSLWIQRLTEIEKKEIVKLRRGEATKFLVC